jgi:hypothetical protein
MQRGILAERAHGNWLLFGRGRENYKRGALRGPEIIKKIPPPLYTPEENKSGPGEWLQRHII